MQTFLNGRTKHTVSDGVELAQVAIA